MAFIEQEKRTFAIVLSDGTVRINTEENNPKAVKREFEDKDGNKKVKFELVYKGIKGQIIDLGFFENDFGKSCNITFRDDSGEDTVLSLNTALNFCDDLLKKLPNINLDKEVSLSPYSFLDDKAKNRKGITVWQNGNKLENYFYDTTEKKNKNNFPDPEGDTKKYDKDDWKMYFMKTRKFLQKYTEENIIPKLNKDSLVNQFAHPADIVNDEIDIDSIPFN